MDDSFSLFGFLKPVGELGSDSTSTRPQNWHGMRGQGYLPKVFLE